MLFKKIFCAALIAFPLNVDFALGQVQGGKHQGITPTVVEQTIESLLRRGASRAPKSSEIQLLAQTTEAQIAEADRLLKQGFQLIEAGNYQAALEVFDQAYTISKQTSNRNAILATMGIGFAYAHLGEMDLARELFTTILNTARENNVPEFVEMAQDGLHVLDNLSQSLLTLESSPLEEANQLLQQGQQYLDARNYQAVLQSSQQALEIYREISDIQGIVVASTLIGTSSALLGETELAVEILQETLIITQQNNLPELEKSVQAVLEPLLQLQSNPRLMDAVQLRRQGDQQLTNNQYQAALQSWQEALKIYQEIDNRYEVASSFYNLGSVYQKLGEYEEAINYYQNALAIKEEMNDHSRVADSLNSLGNTYYLLGEYEKAIDHLQRSLVIAEEMNDNSKVAFALTNLGNVYERLGEYEEAIDYYQHALAIDEEMDDQLGIVSSWTGLGNVYIHLGEYKKAFNYYQRSYALSVEISDPPNIAYALNNMGLIARRVGEYERAIDFYQRSLEVLQKINDRSKIADALNNLGNAYGGLGKYEEALDYLQRSQALFEEIDDRSGVATALNNLGRIYKQLQQYDEAEKYLYQALDVFKLIREGLTDDQKVSIFDTQTDSYRLLQETLIAQNKINEGLEISERGRARAFVELLAQKNQLEVKSLKFANIQKVAQEQQATLVEYSFIDNKQLYVWTVTPQGEVTFKSIDLSTLKTPLEQLVTISRENMGVRNRGYDFPRNVRTSNWEANLQQLHEILIEPIAEYLPSDPEEKVIFMPQGSLFLVPFPALKDSGGTYLLDKHTILTAPAIQVLQLTHQQRPTGKHTLIVGNPTMPKVGFPPEPLNPLPGAETEAKDVANLLGVQPLIGSQATKSAVLSQLPNAGIIHLATHGLLDNVFYPNGAIALTPSGEDDGLLTAGEIIDLKLNADLVILSACNTGRGELTGDGMVGLSRSLLTAGASSVIVSLWEVPDDATAFLMTEFYRLRGEGMDKAKALRQAMFKTRNKYPQPVNWAAFTLNGES